MNRVFEWQSDTAGQRSKSILLTIPNDRRDRRGCAATHENCWRVSRVFEHMRDLNLRSLSGRGHPILGRFSNLFHFLLDILAPTSPLLRLSAAPFEGKRGQLYVRKSQDPGTDCRVRQRNGLPALRRVVGLSSCRLFHAS